VLTIQHSTEKTSTMASEQIEQSEQSEQSEQTISSIRKEIDLLLGIGDEKKTLCDICNEHPATSAFITDHLHGRLPHRMFDIEFKDGSERKNVHYIYVCSTCCPDLQESITYRFCVLCCELAICPKCNKHPEQGSMRYASFEHAVFICECDTKFAPSQNSLDLFKPKPKYIRRG